MYIKCSKIGGVGTGSHWDPRAKRVYLNISIDLPPDFPDPPTTGKEALDNWNKRVLREVTDSSEYFAMRVTGFSMLGAKFERTSPESFLGSALQTFDAHELMVKLPDGTPAVVLLPATYAPAVNKIMRGLSSKSSSEGKSRWDLLLEDD
jgi:hypothetical protein